MISRRSFLTGLGGGLIFSLSTFQEAYSRKKKAVQEVMRASGPFSLVRQQWPPAIAPDYVGIVDRGYACFADNVGRLAIVDLKREDNPLVLGELFGIGKRVVALTITQHRAYAITFAEVGADGQYFLVSLSLTPADDPSVMSKIPLGHFSEPTCVSANQDTVAVGGVGLNGENQVVFYSLGKKKGVEPSQVSALTFPEPIQKLDLQERTLLVLSGADNTSLSVVNVANLRLAEKVASLRLEGSYLTLSRQREQVVVAGKGFDRRFYAKIISLKPSLRLVSALPLQNVQEVFDIASQKGQFLILSGDGSRHSVLPVVLGKKDQASMGAPVLLPGGRSGATSRAHLCARERDAYVASYWGGVQVLNIQKTGWQFTYSHTIPRLPASSVVLWQNRALLASAELKSYDLTTPEKPILVESSDLDASLRSMVSVGRSILCLSRDNLSLRPVERPTEQITTQKVPGALFVAYDRSAGRAFVLAPKGKATLVYQFKVAEDILKLESSFEIDGNYRRAAAGGGRLLVAGLNNLALFKISEGREPLGTRQLANLAVREMGVFGDNAILTCIDEHLRGFFIVISLSNPELPTLASIDLPSDAVSFAVSGNLAVVVGRSRDAKDLATLINLDSLARPKIISSIPVLESASAVAIKDKVAVVVGRGLELISLS